jgi:hypothetical protein
VVKRKIPSPRRESNPRTPIVQPVAQRYTDWAITALHNPQDVEVKKLLLLNSQCSQCFWNTCPGNGTANNWTCGSTVMEKYACTVCTFQVVNQGISGCEPTAYLRHVVRNTVSVRLVCSVT